MMMMTDPRWTILLVCGSMISSSAERKLHYRLTKRADHPHETRIWEVGELLLKSLTTGQHMSSPVFSVWNGTAEERWRLILFRNGLTLEKKGKVIIHLLHVDFHVIQGRPDIELFVLNKTSTFCRNEPLSSDYYVAWHNDILLSTLLDPREGFIIDNKVEFVVRYASNPAPVFGYRDTPVLYWAVSLGTMDLPNSIYTESPKIHSQCRRNTWNLVFSPQGYERNNFTGSDIKTSLFLRTCGDRLNAIQAEYFVENVRSENTLRLWTLPDEDSENTGWHSFVNRDLLINPQNGFVKNGEIVFGVRILDSKVTAVEKDTVTHTWNVGLQSFKLTHTPDDEIELHSPRYTSWIDGREEVRHLKLYPNGSPGCEGYVSLHLSNEEGDQANPLFEVLLKNKEPRNTLRHWMLLERVDGHCQFISKAYLLDPSNGFVVDNIIQLGVRLPRAPNIPEFERPKTTNVWEISVNQLRSGTEKFESQRHKIKIRGTTETWSLLLYPRGNGTENEGFISIYLVSSGDGISDRRGEVFILNKTPENTIRRWFLKNSKDQPRWGKFLKFSDLIDEKNGFVFEGNSKSIKVGFGIVTYTEEGIAESYDCSPATTTVTPRESNNDDDDHGLMNKQSHTNQNLFMNNVTIVHGALKITATEIFSATQFTDLINSWTKDSTSNKPVECIIP